MVVRDFDAMLAERAGVAHTFRVGGQEFRLRHKLAHRKWLKLLAAMRADDTDEQKATADFFAAVVVKADRQRFLDLLDKEDDDEDDEAVIDFSQLDALTDWIMEIITGKLQKSSGSSSPGANKTGAPVNVVSLNPRKAG